MSKILDDHKASQALIIAAFAAVYLIWGSTYLGIRIAIETIPPFLMAGVRFLLAGAILYVWLRFTGVAKPTLAQWRSATLIGALLLLIGNGGVTWAEQTVPSGIAALVVATVPLWMVVLDWIWYGMKRPNSITMIGIGLGLTGMMVLIGLGDVRSERFDAFGLAALFFATMAWATGSLHSRKVNLPKSPFMSTAMQMLCGGGLLFLAGLLSGEASTFSFSALSTRSLVALAYLAIFGSLIAFTAYVWLLRVTTPARVSTYAYVNPVIALILGYAFASEALTPRSILAAAIIVAAVVLIIVNRAQTVTKTEPVASARTQTQPVAEVCLEKAA
ncbi:drug/metabolite exporter YedA [candidate division KSB1 bacterium]|nr:drug/metabolite exporter YedA [candidate division KSB1 bacterium]